MLANIGYGALIITFLISIYGIIAAVYGVRRNATAWVESARNAMLLTFPLITISALSIIILLVTDHYEVEYVANVTSRSMPMYLKITALWGGQAGSLIFWSWLMAAFASAVMLRDWSRDREFMPWVIVVCLVTLAFFLGLSIFLENPFIRLWQTTTGQIISKMAAPAGAVPFVPPDGQGLNPLLRHPGMIIHPPMLYLGFVSFVIPYAFAIAALITGRTDDRWIRITRRWTLVAWLFLSLGLILGGRWAYDVLGWGGYWGWDPVEIAAFMPWLAGTAFLHSVMIQEKRGMLKHWNMVLIILTYDLVIFGTFLTRSGVLSSVHAFAIAALITGRTDDRWIRITRRWTLVAWLFLSLGLILGGRWAYDVLGWGGYWGWDPVEIAAFMPWLAGTAFLHSVMIQEKRGMLKHWNMVLIILTYDLVIFGTFLTRSGVLSSVHAFAQSAIGPAFFAFIGITFITSLALVLNRWNDLKAETHMTSVFSREALFLLNNLLFMGILVVCFWGVIFPLISELFTGQKVTVGPIFYERANGPLFAGLLLLMGVAPLSAWQHSTAKTLGRAMFGPFIASVVIVIIVIIAGIRNPAAILGFWLCAIVVFVTIHEFWRGMLARHRRKDESYLVALWTLIGRNRRRYGGYIIHLGVVLMAIGIIGLELFQSETQGTVPQGGQMTLGAYTMTFDSLSNFDTPDGRNVARAVVSVYRNGNLVGKLHPRRDFYYESQQPMTIPGVRSTMEDDFYVLLVDWQPISTAGATFKIYHNPLVNWLWVGGFVFILGMVVAVWPDREPKTTRVTKKKSSYAAIEA